MKIQISTRTVWLYKKECIREFGSFKVGQRTTSTFCYGTKRKAINAGKHEMKDSVSFKYVGVFSL